MSWADLKLGSKSEHILQSQLVGNDSLQIWPISQRSCILVLNALSGRIPPARAALAYVLETDHQKVLQSVCVSFLWAL